MKDKNLTSQWNWDIYYKSIDNPAPRETLVKALNFFGDYTGFAIDLGCGNGMDTIELLKRGWEVLAIDKSQEGLSIIENNTNLLYKSKLTTKQASFEGVNLPEADFINASLSLPFCQPEYFGRIWEQINVSLGIKGRFAGNLFGEHDEWTKYSNMTFHTKEQVHNLFKEFEIEFFYEYNGDGKVTGGASKHWHYYQVVAKKKYL